MLHACAREQRTGSTRAARRLATHHMRGDRQVEEVAEPANRSNMGSGSFAIARLSAADFALSVTAAVFSSAWAPFGVAISVRCTGQFCRPYVHARASEHQQHK